MRTHAFGRLAILALALALSGLLAPTSVSANNDPHRSFEAATPFDLPAGFCSFPVHFAFPVDREYGTFSTAADGSTIIKTTGSLDVSLANLLTGKTITLNASGPGTVTISPDGTTGRFDSQGLGVFFATNGPQFGLPSNLIQTSGPLVGTVDLTTSAITSLNSPQVLLDVCAALG